MTPFNISHLTLAFSLLVYVCFCLKAFGLLAGAAAAVEAPPQRPTFAPIDLGSENLNRALGSLLDSTAQVGQWGQLPKQSGWTVDDAADSGWEGARETDKN